VDIHSEIGGKLRSPFFGKSTTEPVKTSRGVLLEKSKNETTEGKRLKIRNLLGLEIQAPKIHRSILKLESQFPTRSPFVPSPNKNRFASILVNQVDQDKSLPY
jgi:hypothetical protein